MSDMAIRSGTTIPLQGGGGTTGTTGTTATGGVGQGVGLGGGGLPGLGLDGAEALLTTILNAMGSVTFDSGEAEASNRTAMENLSSVPGDALERLAGFLSLIRSDDILAKLMIEQSGMNRQQALDQRLAARDAAQADLLGQAEETRDAAAKAMAGAIVMAVMTIVASVVTIAMSIGSIKSATGALSKANEANDASTQASKLTSEVGDGTSVSVADKAKIKEASDLTALAKLKEAEGGNLNNKAMANSTMAQAVGGIISAAGGIVQGALDYSAKISEAEGMEKAADAQVDQSNMEFAKKLMEEMADLVRTTLEFIKQMRQAETDLMASMTRV